MSNKIRIETLDGKLVHRCRVRTQRLVDAGRLEWNPDGRTAREIKPRTASSDPSRFLQFSGPVRFMDEADIGSSTGTCDLPYNFPLSFEFLKQYTPREFW